MANHVNLAATLRRDSVLSNAVQQEPQSQSVLVDITPTVAGAGRTVLNFALVIDNSGSMGDVDRSGQRKLDGVKSAAAAIVDGLQPEDYACVVVFSDDAYVVFPSQPVSKKDQLKAVIKQIQLDGGTQMALGMKQAMEQVRQNQAPGRTSRMVLLTDGETADADECPALATECANLGIPITPFGIGAEWNQALLDDVGTRSGGKAAEYVEAADKVAAAFQAEMQNMTGTVIDNAELSLREIPKGAAIVRMFKVLPQLVLVSDADLTEKSEKRYSMRLGQMAQNETVQVLYELAIPPKPAGRFRIGQLELAYDVPQLGLVRQSARSDVVVNYVNDRALVIDNPRVVNIGQVANTQRLVLEAMDGKKDPKTLRLNPNVTQQLPQATRKLLEGFAAGQELNEADKKKLTGDLRKTQRLSQ